MKYLVCILLFIFPFTLFAKSAVCLTKGEFSESVKKIILSKSSSSKIRTLIKPGTTKLFASSFPGEDFDPFDISWIDQIAESLKASINLKYLGTYEFRNESRYKFCIGFENLEHNKGTWKDYAFCARQEIKPTEKIGCYFLNDIGGIADKKLFH